MMHCKVSCRGAPHNERYNIQNPQALAQLLPMRRNIKEYSCCKRRIKNKSYCHDQPHSSPSPSRPSSKLWEPRSKLKRRIEDFRSKSQSEDGVSMKINRDGVKTYLLFLKRWSSDCGPRRQGRHKECNAIIFTEYIADSLQFN